MTPDPEIFEAAGYGVVSSEPLDLSDDADGQDAELEAEAAEYYYETYYQER